MIRVSGRERFERSPDLLWSRLTDLAFVAKTMPGLLNIETHEPGRLIASVRPELPFLRGLLTITLEPIDEQPPVSARMRATGKTIGAKVVVETAFELAPVPSGTDLTWTGEIVERSGLLRTVSQGLLEGAAQKTIGRAWTNFRRELDAEERDPPEESH